MVNVTHIHTHRSYMHICVFKRLYLVKNFSCLYSAAALDIKCVLLEEAGSALTADVRTALVADVRSALVTDIRSALVTDIKSALVQMLGVYVW